MLDNFFGQTNSDKTKVPESLLMTEQDRRKCARTPAFKGKWLNDADEVFSYLERHEVEKDSWWRSMSATLTLLKQAHNIIAKSEEQMKAQAKRIQSLERLSNMDELTGVMNRRGFMQAFTRELDRVDRDKSQGGLLIMIDLDNFKIINDTYGHKAGDSALKVVASTLANDIRTMDVVGRFGGDEFVLLFVNTTRREALERAQFLIKKLNNLSFVWQGEEVSVRASLGLKEYKKGNKGGALFAAADADMYANKKQTHKKSAKQKDEKDNAKG